MYGDCPGAITLAEQIGWTQNVVILEADLDLSLRLWYMRAVRQFGWSKLELIEMIEYAAHTEIVLDNGLETCDNNKYKTGITGPMKAVKYIPAKLFRLIRQRCREISKYKIALWLEIFMRCLSIGGMTNDGMLHICVRFYVGYRIYIGGEGVFLIPKTQKDYCTKSQLIFCTKILIIILQ